MHNENDNLDNDIKINHLNEKIDKLNDKFFNYKKENENIVNKKSNKILLLKETLSKNDNLIFKLKCDFENKIEELNKKICDKDDQINIIKNDYNLNESGLKDYCEKLKNTNENLLKKELKYNTIIENNLLTIDKLKNAIINTKKDNLDEFNKLSEENAELKIKYESSKKQNFENRSDYIKNIEIKNNQLEDKSEKLEIINDKLTKEYNTSIKSLQNQYDNIKNDYIQIYNDNNIKNINTLTKSSNVKYEYNKHYSNSLNNSCSEYSYNN